MYRRLQKMELSSEESCFLWGPRRTGKSTLLKQRFPKALLYDLLLADQYQRVIRDPTVVRQECLARGLDGGNQEDPVIIDEIQKVPELLDEVHWLIENRGIRFVLCGSSARKLRRGQGNLLGGRAVRYELFPLVFPEVPDFSLSKALNNGLIPRHYDSTRPERLVQAYIGDYLKEEITAEALTRNTPAFHRFLEVAALSNGEVVNYTNIASECGVSSPTVKEYFQILSDTLTGRPLPAFRRRHKRRIVRSPKFYFFDLAPVILLTRRQKVCPGSELFGKAFEHFIWMELTAHSAYTGHSYPISYWRTTSGYEVDFVLGDHETAIEVKSTPRVNSNHMKSIRAFTEEHTVKYRIVVSLDPEPRRTEDHIDILPWGIFLQKLWANEFP